MSPTPSLRLARTGRSLVSGLPVLLLAGLGMGCDAPGSGEVRGDQLTLEDCSEFEEGAPFEMPLTFLGVVRGGDLAIARASAASRLASDDDQIVLIVRDVPALEAALKVGGAADPGATLDVAAEEVAVGLSLHARCPTATTPLMASEGTVSFSRFGTEPGARVAATMSFELADARTLEEAAPTILGEGFSGTLDFEVRVGTPYQNFNDPIGQGGH